MRRSLLTWYDRHRRDLPWRRTRDPYAIWVSEIMLQQTQVDRVVAYWRRFLDSYPTVAALAAAPLDDVLALWSGLGYYSRARRLHEAARIVDGRGGRFPSSAGELHELPGVGAYTAAAVASIAFGEAVPVVDANVVRVVSRVEGLRGDPQRARVRRSIEEAAGLLVRAGRPGDVNQALMELGALVCAPAAPRCPECPLRDSCAAAASGAPESFPARARASSSVRLREAAVVVQSGGRVLLTRRPHGRGWWMGLWKLPSVELRKGERGATALRRLLGGDVAAAGVERVGTVRYTVTKHRVELEVHVVHREAEADAGRDGAWFDAPALKGVAVPAPHARALLAAGVPLG